MIQIQASNYLARELVQDPTKTGPLEGFWNAHQVLTNDEPHEEAIYMESPSADRVKRQQSQFSPNGQGRTRERAISTASALAPSWQLLSPHHPALSLPAFLDTFGPLVFPLYKAALLRKRILLMGHAPVELACNFGEYLHRVMVVRLISFSLRYFHPVRYPVISLRSHPSRTSPHPLATPLLRRRP